MSGLGAIAALLAGLAVAALLAACGANGPGGTVGATTATGNASPIGLSRCMRANGLRNFPDPTNGPGGEGFNGIMLGADGGLTVDGINFSGPALAKARRACARYLTPNGPPPQPSAAQRHRILAFAKCMRAHGMTDFPDPDFSAIGHGPPKQASAPPDLSGPVAQKAANACGRGNAVRVLAP
jgi:hypothetical protein